MLLHARDDEVAEGGALLEAAVRRVAAGDVTAFAVVVEHTSARLYRVAARLLGDPEESYDVLQEAYVSAFDAIVSGRFDGRSSVETWLYRIVANAALDALRAQKRRLRRAVAAPEGDAPDPVDGPPRLAARAALRELADWLDELPADQRTALVLKELEGLSTAEIASIMGSSVGAVEQRLVRARATLRKRTER